MLKTLSSILFMSLFTVNASYAQERIYTSTNGEYILKGYNQEDSTEYVLTNAQNHVLWIRKFDHIVFLKPQVSNSGFVAVPGCKTVFLVSPRNNMVSIMPASGDTLKRYWGRDAYCGLLNHCFSDVGDHYFMLAKIRTAGHLLSFDAKSGMEQWRVSYAYPDPRIRPCVLWTKNDRVVLSDFSYDGSYVSVLDPQIKGKWILLDATNGRIIEQYSFQGPNCRGLTPIWHEGRLIVYNEGNLDTYDIETGEKGLPINLQSVLSWLSDPDTQKVKYVLKLIALRPELFSLSEENRLIIKSLFPNDNHWQFTITEILKNPE